MSNPKNDICFSIIVPVYNVEVYLKQCLDSILCQEYSKYELILINDGSTDCSFEICRDYQQKYSKINLIDKINGGLSDARNMGLLAASGDYIIFTDSDDYWVGDTVLKDLNELIETTNPDIIIHEERRFFSSKDIVYKNNQRFIQNKKGEFEDEILNLIYYDLYVASAWDKIIKRSILLDNKLFFPLERKSEDIEWCGKLIKHLKTFSIYSKSFYTYRQARKGSITTSVNEKHINDVYLMVKNGLNSELSQSNRINEAIENYWACNYVVILKDYYVLSSKRRKEIEEDIVLWQYLLRCARNLKIDSVMKFYQYLDFKTLIFLLNIYRIKTIFSKKYRTLRS